MDLLFVFKLSYILIIFYTQMDKGEKKTPMDADAKARIMRAEGKKNDGKFEKGDWAGRAQSAADKNEKKSQNEDAETGKAKDK